MAEFVELNAEEWVPELEQMERIRLFDSKEIKSITTKKKEFEYKIQRKTKSKEDFLKYIQFEVDLYRLVKARRHKMKIHANKTSIEGSQTKRISRLFKQAIFRYQDDIKLWMSFFKYCQEANLQKLGSQMLVRMLQVHSDKENLWAFAAKWDFEKLNSVETARQFLLRGLRHHPCSELLYTELFKLELKYASDKRKEVKKKKIQLGEDTDSKNLEDVIKGKLAEVVYENALTKISNVEFKVNILNLASEYSETKTLQNKIFQNLIKEHSEEEITWDMMAKRELQGISYEDPEGKKLGELMEVDLERELESKTLKGRIQKSVDVYEGAVKKLNTPKMWSFYLDHLIELNNNSTSLTVFKSKLLRNALEGALAAGHLEEKYFLHWIETLQTVGGKPKKLTEVLTRATEQYPRSLKLWHARLRFHLTRDQEKLGNTIFKEAIEKIPDPVEALPLWKLMIQYYQTKSSAKVEETFRAGLERGGELALRLKPMYLHWTALSKGMGCAKKLFESPEMLNPPCLELLNEMISLESMQPDMNKKVIRRCHEMACNFAGKDNLDVWIAYLEFELKHGDGDGPFLIYVRAVRNLNADLVDEFISRYNTLKMDS
ncbi:UNVERIFIED_CONTAM: hypothetical protein PYX00_003820 [Menopon gallinae]|uniref:U3 small nucleolar RNA-associated protein 6 homolog n=1 Tax=Menopon gallinae TaxID=328185 RepID=A0AAW2I329_9NEOP